MSEAPLSERLRAFAAECEYLTAKRLNALADEVAALEQERDRADRLDAALALVTANRDHLRETLARLREAVQEWNKSHPWCDCEECDALRAAAEQGEPK